MDALRRPGELLTEGESRLQAGTLGLRAGEGAPFQPFGYLRRVVAHYAADPDEWNPTLIAKLPKRGWADRQEFRELWLLE
jgi:hypothetical protein